jgi:hypothetical protein
VNWVRIEHPAVARQTVINNHDPDGSGTGAEAPSVTVAEYARLMSGASKRKLPPFSGSPSHHSPLRTKLPLFTNPTGAPTAQVNS